MAIPPPAAAPPPPPSPIEHAGVPQAGPAIGAGLRRAISSVLGPLIGLILVVAIFGAWNPSRFFTADNFVNVLMNNYHYAVAAVGMTFVIVTAGIDLSVGSTMALAGVCCVKAIRGGTYPRADATTILAAAAGAAILVGTPLLGLTFSLPGDGRIGFLAVAVLWALTMFTVSRR
jgi:predicted ABC-type sugar transport system permease subunit